MWKFLPSCVLYAGLSACLPTSLSDIQSVSHLGRQASQSSRQADRHPVGLLASHSDVRFRVHLASTAARSFESGLPAEHSSSSSTLSNSTFEYPRSEQGVIQLLVAILLLVAHQVAISFSRSLSWPRNPIAVGLSSSSSLYEQSNLRLS